MKNKINKLEIPKELLDLADKIADEFESRQKEDAEEWAEKLSKIMSKISD